MSTDTVTVACKLPNGLQLRLFRMEDRSEPVMGGGRHKFKQAVQTDHPPITIKGCAAPFGTPIALEGGYALTPNVPKDFWDEWLKQNADSDIVRNKLIFAHEDRRYVGDAAREMEEVQSGLEPLNPDKDRRSPKGVTRKDAEAA